MNTPKFKRGDRVLCPKIMNKDRVYTVSKDPELRVFEAASAWLYLLEADNMGGHAYYKAFESDLFHFIAEKDKPEPAPITAADMMECALTVVQDPTTYASYVVSLAMAYLQANQCRDIVAVAWAPCIRQSPYLKAILGSVPVRLSKVPDPEDDLDEDDDERKQEQEWAREDALAATHEDYDDHAHDLDHLR